MDIEEATIIREWLNNVHNKMILDVGSGNPKAPSRPHRWNLLYQPILDNNNIIHSLDTTKLPEGSTPYPQIVASAEDMYMIENETYDFILFTSCIEHLKQIRKACDEVYRVLKNNGKAFISVPGSFPNHGGYDNNTRIQSEEEWKELLGDKWLIERYIKGKWYTNTSNQRGWQSMIIVSKLGD